MNQVFTESMWNLEFDGEVYTSNAVLLLQILSAVVNTAKKKMQCAHLFQSFQNIYLVTVNYLNFALL